MSSKSIPKKTIAALLTGLIFLLALLISLSCHQELPSEPRRDNPLDPGNPSTGGEPYELTLEFADGGIRLTWNPIELDGLIGYRVYRNRDEGNYFQNISGMIDKAKTSYVDRSAENGHRYSYYVVAVTNQGEDDASDLERVSIDTKPVFVIEGSSTSVTTTRNVTLSIVAFGARKMLLSNDASFINAQWEQFRSASSWTLSTGEGTKTVYARVIWDTGDTSIVVRDDIDPAPIDAAVTINDGASQTETRHVTLALSGTGAREMMISNEPITGSSSIASPPQHAKMDQMKEELSPSPKSSRISSSTNRIVTAEEDRILSRKKFEVKPELESPIPTEVRDELNQPTTTVGWLPFSESYDWDLLTGEGTKTVYVRLRNDFLIEDDISDQINPTPLNPSISIASGASTTPTRSVWLAISAHGATDMVISNTPVSGAELWQHFSTLNRWELPVGAGTKTVYLKVRNDFMIEDSTSDSIDPQPVTNASIEVISPTADDTVSTNDVRIAIHGDYADSMMVSMNSDLAGAGWMALADTINLDLSTGTITPVSGTSGKRITAPIRTKRTVYHTISKSINTKVSRNFDATSTNQSERWRITDAVDHMVYARFINDFEMPSEIVSDKITVEIRSSVLINDGDASTPTRYVTLTLASENADEMALDTNLVQLQNSPSWQPFTSSINDYELPTGPGTKTVYARFRNSSGAESEVYSDAIEPSTLDPTIVIANGEATTPTRNVPLAISASGATEMKVANDTIPDTLSWQPFAADLDWELLTGEGTKTVTLQVRNDFWIEDSTSDSIEPSPLDPEIVIANGDATTPIRNISLAISATGATEMKVANDTIPDTLSWQPFAADLDWELLTGEGTKTIVLQVRNDFQIEDSTSDSIEPTPMDPAITIANGSATTPTRNVPLAISATGATEMKVANDTIPDTLSWQPFAASLDWELLTGEGTKTVALQVRNDFLIEQTASDTIAAAALNPTILIANGDATTLTRNVPLEITATGATEMRIANDTISDTVNWQPFTASTGWLLSTGEGTKTVALQVRNDFLIEDSTSDTIEPSPLNPAITIANGSATTSTRNVALTLSATGATQMRIANDTIPDTLGWQSFSTSFPWQLSTGEGTKTVALEVRNNFLIEDSTNDTINPAVLGTTAISIQPEDSTFINYRDINLILEADNALQMKLSETPDSSAAEWTTYLQNVSKLMSEGDGYKYVYAWFRNDFFQSFPIVDSIGIDTQVELDTFSVIKYTSNSGDTLLPGDSLVFSLALKNDAFGPESNGSANIDVFGWGTYPLVEDPSGVYTKNMILDWYLNNINNSDINVYFKDRAGNSITYKSYNTISYCAEWNKTFGGVNYDYCQDIIQSQDNNFVIVGYIASLDVINSFLIKFDGLGNDTFYHTYSDFDMIKAYGVCQANDGGYIIVGRIFFSGLQDDDLMIMKVDAMGNKIWLKAYDNGGSDWGTRIFNTNNGKYTIIGHAGFATDNIWIMEIDENGNTTNSCRAGGADDYSINDAIIDQNNNIYITGKNYGSDGYNNVFVIKLNSSKATLWNYKYQINGIDDEGLAIINSSSGDILITGISDNNGYNNMFLLVISDNGNELFNKQYGVDANNEAGYDLTENDDNTYTIVGYKDSNGVEGRDIWIINVDQNGNEIWNRIIGMDGLEEGHLINKIDTGGYIIGGITNSIGVGPYNLWISKIAPAPQSGP